MELLLLTAFAIYTFTLARLLRKGEKIKSDKTSRVFLATAQTNLKK